VPDDERKARRLGDETKGRIAELASGWTVDGESPPAPEPIKREASRASEVARDAPRRPQKTVPPPPPGSPERRALEQKIAELTEGKLLDTKDVDADEATAARQGRKAATTGNLPVAKVPPGPPPVPRARPRTSQVPTTASASAAANPGVTTRGSATTNPGVTARSTPAATPGATVRSSAAARSNAVVNSRAVRDGVPAVAEVDKTKENRGAVGLDSDSLTTNSASGTIGGDTPPPLFDRAAIAAGQKGAVANERRTGPAASAQGTPQPSPRPELLAPGPAPTAVDPQVAEEVGARLAVPVGEFDHAETVFEQDKLRIAHAQATIVRDAASALLGLAEPLTTARPDATDLHGDPTATELRDPSASSTGRFERDDPTLGDERGDKTATSLAATGHAPSGTLRSSAALPRTRGLAGDLRYVGTVVFGLRAARRELGEITAKQATRQQSRRHHLVTLGRTAVSLPEFLASGPRDATGPGDAFDHPALGPARDQLADIEDERSQHAGHVVAADSELTRVRRDREAKAKQYVADLAALDSQLAGFAKRLEPLEKEVAALKKRAGDMHESLRRIDAKIAATEASLTSAKDKKLDRAQVQAELATLRADRKAIQGDEPALAAELDALNPRVAAIEAARVEAQRKRAELETTEQDDQRRVEELLAAIGAKRKVVDRAAADAETARDKILFQLAERLYVDRPDDLASQLAPLDEIDAELGLADRRMMELREILTSVDRWKLARGIALLVAVLGAVGALAGWLFVRGL
jgi:predicted  nucleic acid-binding Zn-ribbon protein